MTTPDRQKLADDLDRVRRGVASDQERQRILEVTVAALRAPEAGEAKPVAWPSDAEMLGLLTECGYDPFQVHPACYREFGWKTFTEKLKVYVTPPSSGNADAVRAALQEAQLQIQYMQSKFEPTGSGNAVLARIRAALSTAPVAGADAGLRLVAWQQLRELWVAISGLGPRCRDCADENGTCPANDRRPCDPQARALHDLAKLRADAGPGVSREATMEVMRSARDLFINIKPYCPSRIGIMSDITRMVKKLDAILALAATPQSLTQERITR